MAIQDTKTIPNESADDIFAVHKNVTMDQQKIWLFGAVAADETVPTAYPLGFNESTGNAGKWMAPDPTVVTVSVDGTIVVNGVATASIDVSADTPDIVQAKLRAIGIESTVTEATDVFTVTLDGDEQVSTVPTVTATSNVVVDGTSTYGLHNIKGIVWPEPIDLKAAGEVNGVAMVYGKVQYAEMAAVVDSGDLTALEAACKSELLPRGLVVEELTQVR